MRALLLTVLCVYGCTTMRPVEPGAVPAVLHELRVDDRISVRTADGWHENLTVVAVTETGFEADAPHVARATYRRDEVLELQVRRGAPGKAAALAAGIYFAIARAFADYD
jgi:hypothetical protein